MLPSHRSIILRIIQNITLHFSLEKMLILRSVNHPVTTTLHFIKQSNVGLGTENIVGLCLQTR